MLMVLFNLISSWSWDRTLPLPQVKICLLEHLWLIFFIMKGYLHYNMITSQNVPFEVHIKNFFVSKKVMFCFWHIRVFVFFTISWFSIYICDIMMSISTWGRVHFSTYLLNHKSLTNQTWLTDRYKQGQYFSEIFLISMSFSILQPALVTKNQLCIVPSISFFWKGE